MFAGPIQDLVDELGRLPGVGPKSAQRIAFHLLERPKEEALRLAASIAEV
ncbi:MAG: recombination mediator RecR, partial [Acidimicrobiales bacterium]